MKVTFFRSPAQFREWLETRHARAKELWVGFYKKSSGKPSITWPESVDEALCVGWIDGIRKRIDDSSYTIRFTPRRPGSIWSAINIRRVEALRKEGRMTPAGLSAFAERRENRSRTYSYEQRPTELDEFPFPFPSPGRLFLVGPDLDYACAAEAKTTTGRADDPLAVSPAGGLGVVHPVTSRSRSL